MIKVNLSLCRSARRIYRLSRFLDPILHIPFPYLDLPTTLKKGNAVFGENVSAGVGV